MASELLVNKLSPQSGTTLTIGDAGDTISFASGVLPALESLTITGDLTVDTNTLYVDSTNNRVGIGTTSPASKFEVLGDISATKTLTSGQTRTLTIGGARNGAGNGFANVDFENYDNLGTSTDFIGARISGINDGADDAGLSFHTATNTTLSEAMRIDSSGNVGIGTTSPSSPLDVVGSIYSSSAINSYNGTTQTQIGIAGTGEGIVGTATNHGLQVRTNGTEAMRIDSSGNVGIGATSPSEKLQVNGNIRLASSGSQIYFGNPPGSGGGTGPYGFRFDDDSANSFDLYFRTSPNELSWEVNGTDQVQIQSDGDIYNTNGTYGTISDEKLKQQITDASSQWEDVKNIRVRKYKLNQQVEELGDSDDLWRLGVVAQELELTSPALISTKPDYSKETGEDLGTTTKTVKMSILYMKAVKALQEAMTRIESLETENTSIKARLTTLENA